MGNEYKFSVLAAAPAAAKSLTKLDKIKRPFILIVPAGVSNLLLLWIDQDQATWPEQRFHPVVVEADIAVQVARGAIKQGSLEVAPSFHHARQKFRAAGVKGRIEACRDAQSSRGRGQMRVGRRKLQAIGKMTFEGNIVPLAHFFRIQVKNDRQGVKFVETWSYIAIFDIGEAAQMNNKIRSPTLASQLVTGSFDVPVGQAKAFASIAKSRAGRHV